jgi:preprotein translocase subunit SecF
MPNPTSPVGKSMAQTAIDKPGWVDVVKHRWQYIGVSLAVLIPGLVFIILSMVQYPTHAPVRLGIDFTGGTILEYGLAKPLVQADLPTVRHMMDDMGYTGSVVQLQATPTPTTPATNTETVANTSGPIQLTSVVSIRTKALKGDDATTIQARLKQRFGPLQLLQKSAIGPTLAQELFTNGLMALLAAYVLIVGYLTFRFQLDYAICAIVAMIHDTLFVIGVFSALGYLFHTEIDSLFITGILTVVGFSVHDTIVVFDRLRENSKIYFTKKLTFGQIANISVNQTLRRSINTSATAMLTLLALYIWGGDSTRDFVLTMLLGILVGTYSSIFVASSMLAWWRGRQAH